MVNKDKSTVINNKNIIQICCEKPTKKQRQNNSNQGSKKQKPSNFIKENEMGSQPFNLVNSFPNASGLGMDRRARFNEAMQDANSTKSPYSVFDNGSNTFERQGNTEGAEQPVQPTINSDTYFEQPQIRPNNFQAPRTLIREGEMMALNPQTSPSRFLNTTRQPRRIAFGSPMGIDDSDQSFADENEFHSPNLEEDNGLTFGMGPFDDYDDDEQRQAYEAQNDEEEVDLVSEGKLEEEPPEYEEEDEEEEESNANIDLVEGPTRFSGVQEQPAPFMTSPYRMSDIQEEDEMGKQETEQREKELQEEQRQEQIRQDQLREEQAKTEQEYKKTEEEKRRNFWIQKDEQLKKDNAVLNEYTKLKEKIIAFIDAEKENSEAENKEGFTPVKAKKLKKVKITKTEQPELRAEINKALLNPDIIKEKKLRERGIGNANDAVLILNKLTSGAVELEKKITDIIAKKEEAEREKVKGTRNPPATRGNIQTFKQAGGAGGAGIQVASGRGQARGGRK